MKFSIDSKKCLLSILFCFNLHQFTQKTRLLNYNYLKIRTAAYYRWLISNSNLFNSLFLWENSKRNICLITLKGISSEVRGHVQRRNGHLFIVANMFIDEKLSGHSKQFTDVVKTKKKAAPKVQANPEIENTPEKWHQSENKKKTIGRVAKISRNAPHERT